MVGVPLNKVTMVMGGNASFGSKFEEYLLSNADGTAAFDGAVWAAQVFKANTGHTLTGLKLPLFFDGGDPGLVTVSIQALSGGDPDGTDLSVATFQAVQRLPAVAGSLTPISMPPVVLAVGVSFGIVVRCASGNSIKWELDGSTPGYTDGQHERSTDSGAAWTADTAKDFCFSEWGFVP